MMRKPFFLYVLAIAGISSVLSCKKETTNNGTGNPTAANVAPVVNAGAGVVVIERN